ncbi:MAG: BPSS1780 family membrane protein [Rhizobacter sp.]
MKLQLVPANRGALWARQGFGAFIARPMAFMGLFGILLLGVLLAQLLPWVGPTLFWMSLPLITLAFMLATQQVLQGRFPTPRVFLTPLRGNPVQARAIWQLGALYAVAMLVIEAVYSLIDGGRFAALQIMMASSQATPETMAPLLSDTRLLLSLLWLTSAVSLLSLPFWHAPALVHWGGQSVAKSLFFSAVACWRNKGAFAVYAFTAFGAVMVFAIISSLLFALVGQPNLAAAAMLPAVLIFTAVFYASLFFTFADCFEMPPAEKETAP